LSFNERLNEQLRKMVYEIDSKDQQTIRKVFSKGPKPSLYFLLLPGLLGWIAHALLYYPCKLFAEFFKNTGHYDSILASVLLLLYPLYYLIVTVWAFSFNLWFGLFTIIMVPFTAWACTRIKYQLGL